MRPPPTRRASSSRASAVVASAALAALLPGCVERKFVIRSDPPGALVSLEGEPVGVPTPVEIPFEFDGVRRVTLTAPGRHVLQTQARLESRWYDWFPLDFVAAFLWPGTIEDLQEFSYTLEPFAVPLDQPLDLEALRAKLEALSARAEEHRRGGSQGPGAAGAETNDRGDDGDGGDAGTTGGTAVPPEEPSKK